MRHAAIALVLLAACGDKGTTITVRDSNDAAKPVAANASARDGRVSIDAPGFKLDVPVPAGALGSGKIDIDGASLVPGARMTGMAVVARGDDEAGEVAIKFEAAGPPDAVRERLLAHWRQRSRPLTREGDLLVGRTDEGGRFTVALRPDGPNTTGEMRVATKRG